MSSNNHKDLSKAKLNRSKPQKKKTKEPERVVGTLIKNGGIHYLLKWKDIDEVEIISSMVMKHNWPRILIRYFEERIVWCDQNKKTEDETAEVDTTAETEVETTETPLTKPQPTTEDETTNE